MTSEERLDLSRQFNTMLPKQYADELDTSWTAGNARFGPEGGRVTQPEDEEWDECQDCHGVYGRDFACFCGKFLEPYDDEDDA